jgi:hypothetical protein
MHNYRLKTRIIVGKKSNNDPVGLFIEDLPHLFISWSEKNEFDKFFQDLLQQLFEPLNAGLIEIAICGSFSVLSENGEAPLYNHIKALLLKDEERNHSGTRLGFLTKLRKELLKRRKKRENSGNDSIAYSKHLIIFVDDLVNLVITRNKNTGLYFLELIRNGPKENIHFIMGSTRSYRGLVQQMIQYEKKGQPSILDNYLPELVISPEGLFFYKRPEELNYTRLFSIHEGEN